MTQDRSSVVDKGVSKDIHWPAVVCYQGDDELVYLANKMDWLVYCDEAPMLTEGDKLIDSSGRLYDMTEYNGQLFLLDSDGFILFAELLLLVKKNACLVQQVCSAKIDVSHYGQLIDLVRVINIS